MAVGNVQNGLENIVSKFVQISSHFSNGYCSCDDSSVALSVMSSQELTKTYVHSLALLRPDQADLLFYRSGRSIFLKL